MIKNNGVCLFLATIRGYEVLKALVAAKKNVSNVLIYEQQSHELENATELIKAFCIAHKISYKTTDEIKNHNYKEYLSGIKPEVVFVVSWRYIIPKVCFTIPQHGIFVLHDSLLPLYRGFAPTNWVIINGEKETGLTLLCIAEEMDAGEIVDQIKIKIDSDETAKTLNDKFLEIYPKILLKNIDFILNNKHKKQIQDSSKATYCCKRIPDDGRINFHNSSESIVRLIKGTTYPYPGAFCYLKGKKIIIWDADMVKDASKYVGRVPGRVVNLKEDYIDILTGDSMIRISSMSEEFNKEHRVKPSKIIKSITATFY